MKGDWSWFCVTGTQAKLDPARNLPDLGKRLEDIFGGVRDDWWALGHKLGQTPSARLAHMPTAAAYNCDFGLMMAWTRLTEAVAGSPGRCLVLCDDPWLFRQLAGLENVEAGKPPPLAKEALKAWARGWLARGRLALNVIAKHFRLRRTRANAAQGGATLLVYGHPGSDCQGHDAYFGSLMADKPDIGRLVHTDADAGLVLALAKDGRTAGLHAWGSPFFAPFLIFQRWRPRSGDLDGPYAWILRRAVSRENATAAPAANRWQMHCQDRWLTRQNPEIVVWPWENHPWERALCRSAKRRGTKSRGYQHAVIGPHQFNPGPASNPDGLDSIPDRVICSGPAHHDQLLSWGIPAERLCIGGAFRISRFEENLYDPDGPVFVATSSIKAITDQMMEAVARAYKPGRKFIVKVHPLYPQDITETEDTHLTPHTIPRQRGLSAVFYGTGTSGLEGLLAGIPTFRFRPDDRVAINVLPEGVSAKPVSLDELGDALDHARPPDPLDWNTIYAPVDLKTWQHELLL